MFSGPPLPLPSDLPFNFLLAELRPLETLGAWARCSASKLRVHDTGRKSGGRVLVSADLGFLLGRCNRVALREGSAPVILEAETVIQWRTLQVITALPHLPGLERLVQHFPGIIHCGSLGLLIPIPARSPEEVLAECLATGVQVTGSRVVYHAPPHLSAGRPIGNSQ
jgi:hypothetical protein